MKAGKGSAKPLPNALTGLAQVRGASEAEKRAVLYYPDAFKRHYLEILDRIRQELARQGGKPVGWKTIRNMVMAPEDEKLAREKGGQRDRINVETTRPESTAVSENDFKGWYDKDKSHLPSDVKFQYIERFVRFLRKSGAIDDIERALDLSQGEYVRDALHLFYRPNSYGGDRLVLKERDLALAEKFVSGGCFEVEAQWLGDRPPRPAVCLLLVRDYGNHVTPVDIVLLRKEGRDGEEGQPDFVPLYTGFLVTDNILALGEEQVALWGKLILSKGSGATPRDDGIASLAEGGTYKSSVTFSADGAEISLATGDDLALLGPVFGVEAGGSDEKEGLTAPAMRRVERDDRIEALERSLAFRYRPWD